MYMFDKEARKTVVREMKDDFKDQPQKIQIFNVQYDPNIKSYILKNSLPTHLDEIMLAQTKQNECISQKHKLYISLGPNNLAFHKLVIGDFIKLGRVQLVVLQINNEQKTESLDFQQIYGSKEYIFHLKEELQGACKVCLSDQATQEDPLVNPCNCKGSCGVIHLGCLKNWINNKVKREIIGKVKTYNFEKYSCEICKAPFPSMIRLQNGTESLLLNFERPSSPYILLQQLSQTEEKQAKTLHFILSEEGNNEVSIGRGQNCELNISDISVSRSHSKIKYENNGFNIYDTTSKFGTLVELKRELIVNSNIRLQHNGCSIDIGLKDEKKQRSKSGKKGVQKNE